MKPDYALTVNTAFIVPRQFQQLLLAPDGAISGLRAVASSNKDMTTPRFGLGSVGLWQSYSEQFIK